MWYLYTIDFDGKRHRLRIGTEGMARTCYGIAVQAIEKRLLRSAVLRLLSSGRFETVAER
jgi:hypothetical protein